MSSLGSTVRRLRHEADLTQEQLAERVEVSPSHISHIESGRKQPSLDLLRRLSREAGVWPGFLLAAVVPTEMPEGLQSVSDRFVGDVLRTVDRNQLALPLKTDRPLAPEETGQLRAS
jgi:transcriptional regulator with XRE-family HTH domain